MGQCVPGGWWMKCRIDEGDGGKQEVGKDRKKAAASVECRQQPRSREKGVLFPAQAAGVFSPTWATGRPVASLLDRRGAVPGAEGQPHPLWPSPDAGVLRVGPPEEAPLPGVVEVAPDDAWLQEAGRGAPGGAEAIPKSPWPSQRPGACIRGLAVLCGFGTPLPRVGKWGGPGQRLPPVPPPCPVRTAGSHYLPSPSPRAPRAGGSPRPGEGRILINPRPEILPEGPGRAAGVRGAPVQSLAIRPHPLL